MLTPEEINEKFAREVLRRRQQKGMSQRELAIRSGIRPPNLDRIERAHSGQGGITLATAYKLAQGLGATVDELVEVK